MEKIKLNNGNVLCYENNRYVKYSNNVQEDIPLMASFSILNTKERRVEKSKYLIKGEYSDFRFGNKNYIFIFNEKNNGVNLLSLTNGEILLKEDILDIVKTGFYGFPFLLSKSGEVFYFGLDFNLNKLETTDINFIDWTISQRKFNTYQIGEFLYNFSDCRLHPISEFKIKENYRPVYSDNNILLCIEPQSRFYILYDIKTNSRIFKENILYFSPFNDKLGYGVIVFTDKILKYNLLGECETISIFGVKERISKIDSFLYNEYFEVSDNFKFLLIGDGDGRNGKGFYLNLVNNKTYSSKIDNTCYHDFENGKDIFIKEDGTIIEGNLILKGKINTFKKTNDIYYIFGENIEFQEFDFFGIKDIQILKVKQDYYDSNIIFYSKIKNKLFLGKTGAYSSQKDKTIYGDILINELPGLASNYFKYFDFSTSDFIYSSYVYGNNLLKLDCDFEKEKYSTKRIETYFKIDGDFVKKLGIDKFQKEENKNYAYLSLDEKIYLLNSQGAYGIINGYSTKDINGYSYIVKNRGIFIMKYLSNILIARENSDGNYDILYNEEIVIDKYSNKKTLITCEEKYSNTNCFSSYLCWILKENNRVIFLDKEDNIQELPQNIEYKLNSKGDIVLNLVERKNGDIFSPIENIDEIKTIENFYGFKKVTLNNKKEYLIDSDFKKITNKDYLKIIKLLNQDLVSLGKSKILVKQSGYTYISNFEGNIIGDKFKKLIPIVEDYDEIIKKISKEEPEVKLKNNYYLGSEDGDKFYLYDDTFNKIHLTDSLDNEIALTEEFSYFWNNHYSWEIIVKGINSSIVLNTNNGKKIIFDLITPKIENKKIFDDIEIYENLTFKGVLGRDMYHFEVITEKQLYSENYYDIVGGIGNFLIVEDRRDFILLNKNTGTPINGNSYKEVKYKNTSSDKFIEVIDFQNNTLFVNIFGEEFIAETSTNGGKYYGISKGGMDIKEIETGKKMYSSNIKFQKIDMGTYFGEELNSVGNYFLLESEDKETYLIDSCGNLILSNKKKIEVIEDSSNASDINKKYFVLFLAKNGKEKYSLFDKNGQLLDSEILTDYSYQYENGKSLKGDISGIEVVYDIKTKTIKKY